MNLTNRLRPNSVTFHVTLGAGPFASVQSPYHFVTSCEDDVYDAANTRWQAASTWSYTTCPMYHVSPGTHVETLAQNGTHLTPKTLRAPQDGKIVRVIIKPITLQGMNFVAKTPAHCGFLPKHSYTVVTWLEGFDAARLIRRGDTGSCYVFGKTCQPQGTRKPCQQSFACIRSTFPSAPEPWISSCPNHSNVNVKLLELNTLNFKLIRPQPSAQTLSPTP